MTVRMENSFVFYHLPRSFTDHEALHFSRTSLEAPDVAQLLEALLSAGFSKRLVWEKIELARKRVEETLASLRAHRTIKWVSFWSSHYPQSLRHLARPPWIVFFIGELPQPLPSLGIVGSRRPTLYGEELIAFVLPRMRTRPLQVLSGLALGVDTLAHRWACECQYPNFAVLAGGLDRIYPEENKPLAERILSQGGGLISEFAPGVAPIPAYFPHRNRIVSGLSNVLWVVQASMKSGSVHTVKHALDQGRRIVVCPGDLFSELSRLPHYLMSEGASPIFDAGTLDEILRDEVGKKTLPLDESANGVDGMV
jgi:DNA processing protein